jgi:hypothetical protein
MARKKRAHLRQQFDGALEERLMRRALAVLTPEEMERTLDRLEARSVDPLTAADEVIRRMGLM